MKNRLIFHILFLIPQIVLSQNISYLEYFWDDPQTPRGHGISVPINESNEIQQSFEIKIDGLTPGVHNLYVRARNEDEVWSFPTCKSIMVGRPESSDQILEWYIDDYPGSENGIDTIEQVVNNIETQFEFNTSDLLPGIHNINARIKNDAGVWSSTVKKTFHLGNYLPEYEIEGVEYFFDIDPGKGFGNYILIEEDSLDQDGYFPYSLEIPSSLPIGQHHLLLRPYSKAGIWGDTWDHPIELSWIISSVGNQNSVANLLVYPIPTKGNIHFELNTQYLTEAKIEMFNSNSQLIFSKTITHTNSKGTEGTLDLSIYHDGLYILVITTPKQVVSKKLFIKKNY